MIGTDTITVLRAHGGRRLAKQFCVATNGVVTKRDYDSATWFRAESVPVATIRDVHALLRGLETDPGTCVIRGEPTAHCDHARTRRRKTGADAPFAEQARHWLMLDVDGVPLPVATSVLDDPADAARALLDILAAHAPEMDGVTAIVQFSSSAALDELAEAETAAGLPPRWTGVMKRGVAAHVWYWLRHPIGEAGLGRWMTAVAAAGLKLDPSTNRTVQPHYTAGPLFAAPLRDPVAGRRTVLIEGERDAADLRIPAAAPRTTHAAQDGAGQAHAGRGYQGHLSDIGGADGFRAPMLRAIAAFIATNHPHPDIAVLKHDIRDAIGRADPGSRPAATIADYASDRHIDSLIAWTMQREQEKRAAQQKESARPIAPTFPDSGVTLAEGERRAAAAVAAFADAIRRGNKPDLLLRITVGAGKSEAAIAALPALLDAAHTAGREGAVYYFVPRHDLGDELLARVLAIHPTLKVAIWRGMDQPDRDAPSDDPTRTMCADRALSGAAMAAAQPATAGCKICKWSPPKRSGASSESVCGYIRQASMRPDVWLMPHNLMFQRKPAGLPDAAVVVVDENFTGAALVGTDALHPVQLNVTALDDDRTGSITGPDRERLLYLRRMARAAIAAQSDDGGLLREAFLDAGFAVQALGHTIPDTADEWLALEWATKPDVKITAGLSRDAAIAVFAEAAQQGFSKLRPMLAARVRNLLTGTDPRSVNASLLHNIIETKDGMTDAIRFEWREDFPDWIAKAPKLFLDATTRAEVLRCWVPDLDVVEIEVAAPGQRVRQVIGAEFGRTAFVHHPANVRRLADLVVVELAAVRGDVLVIAQATVERLLEDELERRLALLPDRLALAHHGNITGLDAHRDAAALIVVGRPAMNRRAGERLAEILRGSSIAPVADGDAARWPTVTAGIRLADGTGRAVRQPRHPDEMVEAVRWSITEGAVIQAIGRVRGVRRDPAARARVVVLGELALPLTVAEVVEWQDAQPGRLAVAAAEAALAGHALPLAPADLARARPDLFPTAVAAEHVLKREKGGHFPIKKEERVPYRDLAPLFLAPARYRKAGGRGSLAHALVPAEAPRAALEAIVGPLGDYQAAAHPSGADQTRLAPAVPRAGGALTGGLRLRLPDGCSVAPPSRPCGIPIPNLTGFVHGYWRERRAHTGPLEPWMVPHAMAATATR